MARFVSGQAATVAKESRKPGWKWLASADAGHGKMDREGTGHKHCHVFMAKEKVIVLPRPFLTKNNS